MTYSLSKLLSTPGGYFVAMHRRSFLMLGAGLVTGAVEGATAQTSGSLAVISARRTKSYASPGRGIRARDEAVDVVIVLRVGGLSREQFRQIDQDSIYIKAANENLPPSIVGTTVVDGKAQLLVVTVGPKATLDMSLHAGAYPEVPFKMEVQISEELTPET
jgi:hypothetical protein